MNKNVKNIVTLVLLAGFILLAGILRIVNGDKDISVEERRNLAQMPEVSVKTITNGSFTDGFDKYTTDQFPYRSSLRGLLANVKLNVFGMKEFHQLYLKDDYIVKVEYPLNQSSIDNAGEKFRAIYDSYLVGKDVNIYSVIVPDKNYFLGSKSGHITLDYEYMADEFCRQNDFMEYIDIWDLLEIDDYYRTDIHWRQEKLLDVADRIVNRMADRSITSDTNITNDTNIINDTAVQASPQGSFGQKNNDIIKYDTVFGTEYFKGVQYGQLAMNITPDTLYYVENDILANCKVTEYSIGKPNESVIFDVNKLHTDDPYEAFLCGSNPLVIIENPACTTDKELVVFRDSFGSSLVPLLVNEYSKVTLVDIRYMFSNLIGNFVQFDNQDVLFLYSTLVLNNSTSFK